MPVPFGLSQGPWHSKENSLDHRFYLPKVASIGGLVDSLGQVATSQKSDISKRK